MKEIFDFENNDTWLSIIASVLFLEVFFIIVFRKMSPNLDNWYKDFGLNAILSDCSIILLGFALVRYLYTRFIYKRFGYSPLLFVATLVAVQIIHDSIYYFLIVLPYPSGSNKIIDFMKKYGKEGGVYPIIGDSSMMIGMGFFAMLLNSLPREYSVVLILLALYAYPYLLN